MEENPFSSIISVIRKDGRERARPVWSLGKVVSALPLVISTGGLEFTGEELRVNLQLLPNPENVTLSGIVGSLDGSVDCSVGSITNMYVSGGTLAAAGLFGGILSPGDQVALLCSEEGPPFVVLCKVVDV